MTINACTASSRHSSVVSGNRRQVSSTTSAMSARTRSASGCLRVFPALCYEYMFFGPSKGVGALAHTLNESPAADVPLA